jgi:hypothetical protein
LDSPPRERGKQIHTRGTGKDLVLALMVRGRTGAAADFKLTVGNAETVEVPSKNLPAKDAIPCSDSGSIYKAATKTPNITHRPVNLAAGIRAIAKVCHIQNANAYGSWLK